MHPFTMSRACGGCCQEDVQSVTPVREGARRQKGSV
jgi:hypothetical protein